MSINSLKFKTLDPPLYVDLHITQGIEPRRLENDLFSNRLGVDAT